MTDKLPEALRLAESLDLYSTGDKHQRDVEQAATELRRLHEVNAELVEALIGVVRVADRATVEFAAAKGAIAKATGEQQ
jgi:hypothetical protein